MMKMGRKGRGSESRTSSLINQMDKHGSGVSSSAPKQQYLKRIQSSVKRIEDKIAALTQKCSDPESVAGVGVEQVDLVRISERSPRLTQRQLNQIVTDKLGHFTEALEEDCEGLQKELGTLRQAAKKLADSMKVKSASRTSSSTSLSSNEAANEDAESQVANEEPTATGSRRVQTPPKRTLPKNMKISTPASAIQKKKENPTSGPRRSQRMILRSSSEDSKDADTDYVVGQSQIDEDQVWTLTRSQNRRNRLDNSSSGNQVSKKKMAMAQPRHAIFDPIAGAWTRNVPNLKKRKRINNPKADIVVLKEKKPKPPTTSVFSQVRGSPPRRPQRTIRMVEVKMEGLVEPESEPEIQDVDVVMGDGLNQIAAAQPGPSTPPLFSEDEDDSMLAGTFASEAMNGDCVVVNPGRNMTASVPASSSRFVFRFESSPDHPGTGEEDTRTTQAQIPVPIYQICSSSSSSSSIMSLPMTLADFNSDADADADADATPNSQTEAEENTPKSQRKFKINIKPKDGESYLDLSPLANPQLVSLMPTQPGSPPPNPFRQMAIACQIPDPVINLDQNQDGGEGQGQSQDGNSGRDEQRRRSRTSSLSWEDLFDAEGELLSLSPD